MRTTTLQYVPGLIFRAFVLRLSHCVREKYGTGDEANLALAQILAYS